MQDSLKPKLLGVQALIHACTAINGTRCNRRADTRPAAAAAPFCMKQLAYHWYGNYLMQLIVCVGAAARAAAGRGALESATARALAGCYAHLLKNLASDFADMCQHQMASHVLDCLVATARPSELLDIVDEIGQSALQLLSTKWGFKFFGKLMDKTVRAYCPVTAPC
jgi:hypothetical protein